MSRNERTATRWSAPAKNCGLRSDDLDDLGDIVSAFARGERARRDQGLWQRSSRNVTGSRCYSSSSSDCCLKNGRVQCSCSWTENSYRDKNQGSQRFPPRNFNRRSAFPFENKSSQWPDNNGCCQDNKMVEEFVLDDNELCLLNYYDIPFNVPKRRHVRNVGKVKTVSIIDTLSELASGATDREDEGGFSSAVSESAILDRCLYRPKARHTRQPLSRRDRTFKGHSVPSGLSPKISEISPPKKSFASPLKTPGVNFPCHSFAAGDDGHFTCSSLKRTLKYLRKAVSTNVPEDETRVRKYVLDNREEDDAFRLCFSDSEVKGPPQHWTSVSKRKDVFHPMAKSKSTLTVVKPSARPAAAVPSSSSLYRNRAKAAVPDWIQEVFGSAKKGDVEKMKYILKDIDPALVRNLSDDHGNNLWHICAVHNSFECLNWLCNNNQHHTEALKDENKNGFSPVCLAVKHGSLLAVQWLIHNTVSKSQVAPQNGSRSLLHVASRYGQVAIVEWLLSYMKSQNVDAGLVDAEGNTPLHLASKYGHISCIKALVFQIGCLKTKNEHGLKPLDLAVKHCKTECADYLIALESCYNLAAMNLRQQSEMQQLQKENTDIKNFFKELFVLAKRLHNRQKELCQSFSRVSSVPPYDRCCDKNNILSDDYSQLLATVIADEEHHLHMVEDRWKKLKKQGKCSDPKKKPLDILRSQFAYVLDKVDSCPPIPSSPETSDESWKSDDEDNVPKSSIPEFSAPDLVNTLSSFPFSEPKQNCLKSTSISSPAFGNSEDSSPTETHGACSKNILNSRDVNLHMFFKQNPSLRQSGETCSVLEVLEPSSSDSESCSGLKQKPPKNYSSEREAEQSSSSSAFEAVAPSHCRPSSSGSKTSGSRSSSNGSRKNLFPHSFDPSYNPGHPSSTDKTKQSENDSDKQPTDMGSKDGKSPHEQLSSTLSAEPDLIKGTQKKKPQSAERERKAKSSHSDNPDNPSTDNESLEADRSFSSSADLPEASMCPLPVEPGNSGTIKKKSFLLKFALRGRWPSKTAIRSLKNEISPEEFRETYSRTATSEPAAPTSQPVSNIESPNKKMSSSLKIDLELVSPSPLDTEKLNDSGILSVPTVVDNLNPPSRRGLLPPRRDPPPAPPTADESNQDQSDDEMSVSIQKSAVSSCADDCMTSSVSLHTSYLGSRASDIWHSPDSKALFRPASSASRAGSLSRGDENFGLNKSSSASTEMLSTLDSSTAGRHSPAPSEVSKTESALSPPSDVSKTESTRYLSQLGRIEETGSHLTAITISSLHQQESEPCIKEPPLSKEEKPEVKHKKKSGKKINSDKPWYEFSDEEDIIVPQRYQAVSVSMRSSSDDEGAVTG